MSVDEGTTTSDDLAAILADDHGDLAHVCTELDMDQGSPEHRKALADHLVARFVQHLVAEDLLHPDHNHDHVDAVMRQLVDAGPQQPEFETLLTEFVLTVRQHVNQTGPAIVRRAQSDCPPDRLRSLGRTIRESRDHGRSLPHPTMVDRLAPHAVLNGGPGLVERARAAASELLGRNGTQRG